MKTYNLSPEQRKRYFDILEKYQQFRKLSREEKEDLILRITSTEYIDLLCDWAFKHVFGHNKEHLMMLLNDFLPVKITGIDKIEYDPNEVDVFKGDDKQVIMDVLCHTDTEQIIVEMQKSLKILNLIAKLLKKWFKNLVFYVRVLNLFLLMKIKI